MCSFQMCIIWFPDTIFLMYLNEVLPPDTSEVFLHGTIFDKTPFCVGERQRTCMLVNNECSSRYSRVGDF